MGDTEAKNVPALVGKAGELQIVAPYVTGSPDIKWTAQQRALFPAPRWQQATIDQGFTGSPVPGALIRDVESGGWSVSHALTSPWDNPKKTIYIEASRLGELAAAGWHGNVWLAHWTGIRPLIAPPMPAGITCVAQQYASPKTGSGGPYDLSAVFDPNWPETPPEPRRPANRQIPGPPRQGISAVCVVLSDDFRIYVQVWDEETGKWTAPAGAWPVAD
jgi:hypothetical protein